ncbi:MAG: substrate-binding domain-containing protein [Sedimentisphaerales bacterium]|nr:substrate-binding domain-containing protein [Sedimentisphaerales bacterium]
MQKRVLLLIDTSRAVGQYYIKGVGKYIHTYGNWRIYVPTPRYLSTGKVNYKKFIEENKIDGIIALDAIEQQQLSDIHASKIPLITHSAKSQNKFVKYDAYNLRVGEMAAEYFIELGFRNFMFVGIHNYSWSKIRLDGYKKVIDSRKDLCLYVHKLQNLGNNIKKDKYDISELLRKVPKPYCIFACNDDVGFFVLEVCKDFNIQVPEEAAVLGADNDVVVCRMATPPLSSIKIGYEKGGYEDAKALNKLMNGDKNAFKNEMSPMPQYIKTRQSSNIIAIDDPEIKKALMFIRENFKKPIQVSDTVWATGLSKRMLQLRFRKVLKRSIHDEIKRVRLEYIKDQLRNSRISIKKISQSQEFMHPAHFCRFFKKSVKMSPLDYRHKYGSDY